MTSTPTVDREHHAIARRYWLLGAASQNPRYFTELRAFDASRTQAVNADEPGEDLDVLADPEGLTYFEKISLAIEFWLKGATSQTPHYQVALDAFAFGARYHTGVRKDGVTPEYQHQIQIALAVRNHLKDLMFPVETLALVFLHDVVEDHGVTMRTIMDLFGARVADAVDRISKVVEGVKKSRKVYFRGLSGCPISSVGKGFDREHNMDSMIGVFAMDKIGRYTDEVETEFFTMLKKARLNFPEQEGIYESLKNQLESQVKNARALLAQHDRAEQLVQAGPSALMA